MPNQEGRHGHRDRRQGPRQERQGLRIEPEKHRVFVEGLNIVKRHQRAALASGPGKAPQAGGIIEHEGPIHVSNVMLLDPKDNKPTRVGMRADAGGKRVRYSKRTGEVF